MVWATVVVAALAGLAGIGILGWLREVTLREALQLKLKAAETEARESFDRAHQAIMVSNAVIRSAPDERVDKLVAQLHQTVSTEAHAAEDFLRALTDVLKRAAQTPSPEKRTLRVQHRLAPPDWQAGARDIDGRKRPDDPVCVARMKALAAEDELRAKGELPEKPITEPGRILGRETWEPDDDVA